ncbi:MAG: hypothetical protein K8R69_06745 [Deltaproteobacteria bacterium]|nr:hypothetical protein [Deltaproteobacteria bacterium]
MSAREFLSIEVQDLRVFPEISLEDSGITHVLDLMYRLAEFNEFAERQLNHLLQSWFAAPSEKELARLAELAFGDSSFAPKIRENLGAHASQSGHVVRGLIHLFAEANKSPFGKQILDFMRGISIANSADYAFDMEIREALEIVKKFTGH